uniref:Aldose 1-epimerase family protein n=1 Tax=Roseihalotalea indica TaxID=2867963 RepID=A0AA49GUS8_9BACT|nr:aldose 1-epimerase family protein [Tunicatimonas sp. TK19036]
MPQYVLENEYLTATFKTEGAELTSVQDKASGQEYIWQADPTVWARHAPVLFPIVGRLKDDTYQLNGDTYTMTQHGFARDMNFSVVDQSDDHITFGLTASPDTHAQYPFNFVLDIQYTLKDRQLEIVYRVTNQDQKEMPFSIGAHPAFYCPAQQEHHWEEYQLAFEKPETLVRHMIEDGLRNGKTEPLMDDEIALPLHRHLFEADAIVFENLASDEVSIVRQSDGKSLITVKFPGFSYLGIWQKLGSDFFCIEPWYGVADSITASGDLFEKEGMQRLSPEEQFEATHSIIFH